MVERYASGNAGSKPASPLFFLSEFMRNVSETIPNKNNDVYRKDGESNDKKSMDL